MARMPTLWGHQKKTFAFADTTDLIFDMSDPGTGKTRAHLAVFEKRRAKSKRKLLIVCPKTLMDTAWQDELDNSFPHLTYALAYAPNRERDKQFARDVDVYIVNADGVKWLATKKRAFFKKFTDLIIDESTDFKTRTSARSKAVASIVKYFTCRTLLTATPTPKTVQEIWHQVKLLDDGERLGKQFFAFRGAVCKPEQTGPRPEHVQWVDKPDAEEAVMGLLSDITIRHAFEDCMDIPPNSVFYKSFALPKTLLRKYLSFLNESVLMLKSSEVNPVNAAVMQNKLLQMLSGAVYYNDDEYEVIDNSRYAYVTDLINQRRHSITFFLWKHQRAELTRMLDQKGLSYAVLDGTTPQKRRKEIVSEYQNGEYRTLLMHPKTGAHGLTLTKGTSTIFTSPVFQSDWIKQGKHRIYRGGQTERTETLFVVAKDTIEEEVYKRAQDRMAKQNNLLKLAQDLGL